MENVLTVNNITKYYGKTLALNDVSISIPQGSVFGILGPNGSGKTTLLSIILDVLLPNAGDYNWFGEKDGRSNENRKKIGSLLETPNFYHYLSAKDNLEITQAISERGTPEDIAHVLETVNLLHQKNNKFSTFSLGMKQRLAIGGTLLGYPQVLVLDEPTNGLDPVGIAEIRNLIKDLSSKGITIIMASHLLDEVEKVCTHVAILKKGTLLTAGNVNEVLVNEEIVEISSSKIDELEKALSNFSGFTGLKREGKSIFLTFPFGQADLEALNRFCFDNNIILNQLILRKKTLEAKFFELTNQ